MKKSTIKIAGFMMLAMLLGGHNTASAQNFDLNGDGAVDVADMSALITYMAGNPQGGQFAFRKQANATKLNESAGTAVDLGLPSGRKWADRNIGYSQDPDYGTYFAWGGRTAVTAKGKNYVFDAGTILEDKKTAFTWKNYEWICEGGTTWKDVCKYTIEDGAEDAWWYGYGPYGNATFCGDGIDVLEEDDDAATFHWKGKWRMPYTHEIEELLEYTTQTWTFAKMTPNSKEVWGCEFKGPNGKTIFLPAAGSAEYQYVEYRDGQYKFPRGKYWGKEVDHNKGHFGHQPTSSATILSINRKVCCEDEAEAIVSSYERQYGLSIRPVLGD